MENTASRSNKGDLTGGPVVKTPYLLMLDPTGHMAGEKKKKKPKDPTMNFPETNEPALQTGPQAKCPQLPSQASACLPPTQAQRKKGSELSSRENSKAVSHFILKIHTKFEFHSTGY